MFRLELIRPLFHDMDDEEPFCISNLEVDCPEDFTPSDPACPDEWLDLFAWIGENYPGWMPHVYYWTTEE